MRSSTAFLFGALAGAFAILTAKKFLEDFDSGTPTKLTNKMDQRLQELEGRLDSNEELAS
jgi:hypothetical protein